MIRFFGVIPAGSGNGVAASLGGADPVQATLAVVNSTEASVDLFSVHRLDKPSELPTWDVHFFCWAAFADHDFLTEGPFRSFGPLLKLTLAPLLVIARAWSYKGTVDLLPIDLPAKVRREKHYSDPKELDLSQDQNPAADVVGPIVLKGQGDTQWRRITADWWVFALGNLCYAGIDALVTPHAERCEGALDLITYKVTPTASSWSFRWDFVKMFANIETGAHIESAAVDVYKVRAVILRPDGNVQDGTIGHMQCSGEEMAAGDVLVQSHKGMLRMFVGHDCNSHKKTK